jgi:hypothetical protein
VNPLTPYLYGLAVLTAIGSGWYAKSAITERDALKVQVSALQTDLRFASKATAVTSKVLTARAKSVSSIKSKAKDVQVEIEKRLPDVAACVLPPDWRVLHDAAAADEEVPPAAERADAAAVTPKEAARTVARNYEACHDNSDRLLRLQQWVEGVSEGKE